MKKLHLAYIAGFFDGEGCVCIDKSKDLRTKRGYTDRIRVMVSQVDRDPLDRIKDIFGGIITLRETGVHELVMSDIVSIRRFLGSILAYLIVKKSAATAGIMFCDERLAAVSRLRERNAEIVGLRLADPKAWTHSRLALRFGVSKQRVTQLLNKKEAAMDRP